MREREMSKIRSTKGGQAPRGIETETIESIEQGVDMVALAEAKGIGLKKNGKSYFGLCPFHDDTTPSLSVNPSTNLWQCFACGAGGDVIRFVELFDNWKVRKRCLKALVFRP